MIPYSIQLDEAALADARELFGFIAGNSDQALKIALNKTAPKIRTAASRAIRSQVRLRARYVGEKLFVEKASSWNLQAAIFAEYRGMLMPRYSTDNKIAGAASNSWVKPPKTPEGGIPVKVKTGGSTKYFRGTESAKPFFMVLRNSNSLGIVARRDVPGERKGKIVAFYGPSVSQVFGSVRQQILPQAGEELTRQMIDAMRYLTLKALPPEGGGA